MKPLSKIKRIICNLLKHPKIYSRAYFSLMVSIVWDKRLGIRTCGYSFPADRSSLYGDASVYAATNYPRLKKMIAYLKMGREDVFVDLGCGAGRAVFFAGAQRLKKAIGIEIRKELVDIARMNLSGLKLNNTPVEIIEADAASFDMKEGTVFFMFNPFGESTFSRVIENIKKSLEARPRAIRVAYCCPVYGKLLNSCDWLSAEGEIGKTDIFVWRVK